MSDERNARAAAEQLSEPELAEAAGGWGADDVTYVRCNKDYCGYRDDDGQLWYTACPRCDHAMHFETHNFLGYVSVGHTYCDKCNYSMCENSFKHWGGTEQGLIESANERL